MLARVNSVHLSVQKRKQHIALLTLKRAAKAWETVAKAGRAEGCNPASRKKLNKIHFLIIL